MGLTLHTLKKSSLLAVVAALALCLGLLAGCSGSSASSSAASSSDASESSSFASSALVLGAEGDGAESILFTNDTGVAIQAIAVAPAASGQEPVALMEAGEVLENGKPVEIFQKPVDGNALFDIVLTTDAGTYTLHNVNFATADKATIHMKDGIAYLALVVDGSVISTFEDELAIATPAPVEEEVAPEETSQGGDAPVYEEPASGGTSAPAQSGDQCVEGGVQLRG